MHYTVPCPRILRPTPEASTLESAELHSQEYCFKIIKKNPRKRCDHGFEEIDIYCLHTFVGCICIYLRTKLRLMPVEIEQGGSRVEAFKDRV